MKSLIFLAGLCVVAVTADEMSEDQRNRLNAYINCFPEHAQEPLTNFIAAMVKITPAEKAETIMKLEATTGMMDESGWIRFDKICQEFYPDMSDQQNPICTGIQGYIDSCKSEALPDGMTKGAYVFKCAKAKVEKSCLDGMSMAV